MAEQQSPYPLRLPEALHTMLADKAGWSGQSLNTWMVEQLNSSCSDRLCGLDEQEMTLRVQQLRMAEKAPTYSLRMPKELREALEAQAKMMKLSLNMEITFRLIACLSGDEFAKGLGLLETSDSTSKIDQRVKDAWQKIDNTLAALSTLQLNELPGALKSLETDRRRLSRLMGVQSIEN